MSVKSKLEKYLLMKYIMMVPSTVEKASISILLLQAFSPSGAARASKNSSYICYITWITQPFPRTLPNSTFLGWGRLDNSQELHRSTVKLHHFRKVQCEKREGKGTKRKGKWGLRAWNTLEEWDSVLTECLGKARRWWFYGLGYGRAGFSVVFEGCTRLQKLLM